ncbi:endonuclease VII [Arthrobacter phage MidnightRain]|nr:endonuclease VII [Arthrobacter phage MidnightRain]
MESNRKRSAARTHCAKCGVELNDQNCHRRAGETRYRSDCKECRAVRRRELHDASEESKRLMLDRQVCDICHRPETSARNGVVRLLNKDHNHQTGEWRGLLCSRCNTAIGLFNDNVALLKSAIDYLENPPGLVLVEDEPAEARQDWRKGPYGPKPDNKL